VCGGESVLASINDGGVTDVCVQETGGAWIARQLTARRVHRPTYDISSPGALAPSPGGVVVTGVRRTNEVNPRPARLAHGRVTVFGRVYRLGM